MADTGKRPLEDDGPEAGGANGALVEVKRPRTDAGGDLVVARPTIKEVRLAGLEGRSAIKALQQAGPW